MKKRTIAIVSVSLVLALLAVAVIATFPTYLLEDDTGIPATTPDIQSDNVTEATQGEDVGVVGGTTGGAEGILPDVNTDGESDITETQMNSLSLLAEKDGAKLLAENGAFDKDADAEIDKLGAFNKKYYRARHYVRDFAKNYTMYNITVEKDGKAVQPIGIAKVVIEIPEKYDIDKVEVYYMLSDGGVQKLDSVIDKDARTATVSFTQSGVYILIERDTDVKDGSSSVSTSSDNTSSESENSSSTPSDTSSEVGSDGGSSNNGTSSDSDVSSDNGTSSDSTSSAESDPNKDTMDGWTPWY